MEIIRTENLTKKYGDLLALNKLNIEVKEGEVFGFLGPNGSGKSTTINILMDLVRPTEGSAYIFGHNCQEESLKVKEKCGFLPENYDIYNRLTGRKHIEFAIKSRDANDDPEKVLERVGILDAADRRAGGYSEGMTKRLCLGMALVGQPDLIIFDEPTNGLDPDGAREIREITLEEKERGATIFFSSHVLDQVQKVSDRVAILKSGELIAKDTIEGLRKEIGSVSTIKVYLKEVPKNIKKDLMDLDGIEDVSIEGNEVVITLRYGVSKKRVINGVEEAGGEILDFKTEDATLEDLFTSYTSNRNP